MALDPSGVPSRQDILDAIAEAIPQSVRRVVSAATDSSGDAYIPFGETFDAPPVVVAANVDEADMTYDTVTVDGFTVHTTPVVGPDPVLIVHFIAMEAS